MTRTGSADWVAIRQRLERSMDAIDPDAPERRDLVLRDRAAALARPPHSAPGTDPHGCIEVLAFDTGGTRYAVETRWVAQACAMPRLTALPGVPAHVAGIVPFRGQVLAVLDLRALLALPVARLAEPAGLVVLEDKTMQFGLLADAVGAVRRYPRSALAPDLPGLGARRAGYLLGVAPDRTAILDAARMLGDPGLVVHEQ
jgi:purine-binding chemotaxis protein CheW